jgi:hypothetical protein
LIGLEAKHAQKQLLSRQLRLKGHFEQLTFVISSHRVETFFEENDNGDDSGPIVTDALSTDPTRTPTDATATAYLATEFNSQLDPLTYSIIT